MTKIVCEKPGQVKGRKAKKTDFDKRSFRWKQSGSAWILVACPRGQWMPRKERCKVGTRAYKIVTSAKNGRCKRGSKRIGKRR